jgi:membrane associated rhomboid family serine protease
LDVNANSLKVSELKSKRVSSITDNCRFPGNNRYGLKPTEKLFTFKEGPSLLAIPLTKKIHLKNPPVATIAIIMINVLVFIIFQTHDGERYAAAKSFYFRSGLSEIEFPLYLNYLKAHRPQEYRKLEKKIDPQNPAGARRLYHRLQYDTPFIDLLEKGQLPYGSKFEKNRHEILRLEYDDLQKKIVSLYYGFRPARPRLETWLTSMFLHGGVEHLLGNMVFLWLIGCLIEYGCRRWLFLVLYSLGGLAATGFYWILNAHSLVPSIGASGAIAGTMGAFTVFYGLKRVRVFLTLGFYFNYLQFPGIVMLPLWIGNEAFQMTFNQGSGIAYAAHLGGLMGGAAMALILRRIPNLLDLEAFEDADSGGPNPLIEKALDHMGRLEFDEARTLLLSAAEDLGDDEAVLKHLYLIDRQNPSADDFHRTSRRRLEALCRQPETYAEAFRIYREYLQLAKPARLGDKVYLLLSRVFCDMGKSEDAHRLVAHLVKNRPALEDLPLLLLRVADLHAERGNRKARTACLKCICNKYPMSTEARIAQGRLEAG